MVAIDLIVASGIIIGLLSFVFFSLDGPGYSHQRPDPTTEPPKLPVVKTTQEFDDAQKELPAITIKHKYEIERIRLKNALLCEHCGQSQPGDWEGGACFYCGAPVSDQHMSDVEMREKPRPMHNHGDAML